MHVRRLTLISAALTMGPIIGFSAGLTQASPAIAFPVDDTVLVSNTHDQLSVDLPLPGHSTDWEIETKSVAIQDINLALNVTLVTEPVDDPVQPLVSLWDASGRILAQDVPLDAFVEPANFQLDGLSPGEITSVTGTIRLPTEASNAYQGKTLSTDFRFMASHDTSAVPAALERTGASASASGWAFAMIVIGSAFAVLATRTRRRNHA